MEAPADRKAFAKALPDILCYAPDDVKDRKRKAQKAAEAEEVAQPKRQQKATKARVQFDLQPQPRRSPRNKNKALSRTTGTPCFYALSDLL